MKSWMLATKLLRREWRAGELSILFAALFIAVTCLTSVNLFATRIHLAMLNQSGDLLGADVAITSANPLPKSWLRQAKAKAIRATEAMVFLSMLSANHQFQLANVKAVDAGYPMRGYIKVMDSPEGNAVIANAIPAPGTIWLEPDLLPLLHVKIGDTLTLGVATFQVARLINYQPLSPGSLFSFSPQALINVADVAKTAVVQPGSRIQYSAFFAGDATAMAAFNAWLKPQLAPGQRLFAAGESYTSLQNSLEHVQHYLGLGSLVSVILAGVALAVALKRFTRRHYDMVALMRCYGASARQVLLIYGWLLLSVGIISILLACISGYFAQAILQNILAALVQVQLPAASLSGAWFGVVAGVWVLLAFGLPPLWQLTRMTPLRVLRRDVVPLPLSSVWLYASGLVAVGGLIFWYIHDAKLTLIILMGCIAACVLFLLMAKGLIALTQRLRKQVGVAWRYGFANLGRRWQSSVLQITAFGFTLMVLFLLVIVRDDLVTAWQHALPADTSNYFVINIAPDEVDAIKRVLAEQPAIKIQQIYPMIRGRLYQLNQQPILTALTPDKQNDESLNRELNLSWSTDLPHNNEIVSGRWWQSGDSQVISVEQGLAERLGLKLGDELTFRVGAQTVSAKIISLRHLNWSSLTPNFYVIFPPGLLENYPRTYITSFYLPPQNSHPVLNALLQRFPNLTIINIAEVLKQVQHVLSQAGDAIQYLFFFALLAGFVVLYASIYATLDQRLSEGAILRALGASRHQLLAGLAAEFITLGGLSGLLAAGIANGIGMALGHWIFGLELRFNYALLLIGVVLSAALVGLIGVFATRGILRQSPLLTMRDNR